MVEMNIRRLGQMEYHAVEAINTLCTNLSFAGGDIKKIMLTSCHPQEGKSFISMNLLRAMAGLGMRVVLVDADIRASAMQGTYGIEVYESDSERYLGLSGYLAGRCDMQAILARTNIAGAYMVLAGKTVTNSLPLINTPKLGDLLNELAHQFDVVLIDAPPIGTIIDAARIAVLCDGTLFVVQSGAVTVDELKESTAQIEKAGCPVMGYVLNKFDEKRFGGKYHYYNSYYTGAKEKRASSRERPAARKSRDRIKRG